MNDSNVNRVLKEELEELPIDFSRDTDLTIGEIKTCILFENVTEDQLHEVLYSIKQLTLIVYEHYLKEKIKANEKFD